MPQSIDIDSAIVHFVHSYPGEFRGGEIRWWYFWYLYSQIGRVYALQRSITTSAHVTAEGIIHGDHSMKQQAKNDLRQAFQ